MTKFQTIKKRISFLKVSPKQFLFFLFALSLTFKKAIRLLVFLPIFYSLLFLLFIFIIMFSNPVSDFYFFI